MEVLTLKPVENTIENQGKEINHDMKINQYK